MKCRVFLFILRGQNLIQEAGVMSPQAAPWGGVRAQPSTGASVALFNATLLLACEWTQSSSYESVTVTGSDLGKERTSLQSQLISWASSHRRLFKVKGRVTGEIMSTFIIVVSECVSFRRSVELLECIGGVWFKEKSWHYFLTHMPFRAAV